MLRRSSPAAARRAADGRGAGARRGAALLLAGALVWCALAVAGSDGHLTPLVLLHVPLDGLALVGVVLALPRAAARGVALVAGVLLGPLTVLAVLDVAFTVTIGRPFDPLSDWGYLRSAEGLLGQSIGHTQATAFLVLAVLVVAAALVLLPLSLVRVTRWLAARRTRSAAGVGALTAVWAACAALGVQLASGSPGASSGVVGLVHEHAVQVSGDLRARAGIQQAAAADPLRRTPSSQLLTGLRGKDVLLVFVESYGKVAVEGPGSARVDAVLDDGTAQLHAAGFDARSAFLTSPTFGGISWLAHATLQSGVRVDTQQRYDDLVATDRATLSSTFRRAGWRTVADAPSDEGPWAQGTSFYHYDRVYGGGDVGYRGPAFSYAAVPDQYTLEAFRRLELAPAHRRPVMAEIDLVSSHTPWAPLPRLVDPAALGDGSVYDAMPSQGASPAQVWRDPAQVRAAYRQSIAYSLQSLVSFVRTAHDDHLVLVVLGDHQPATIVSGAGASHDVPVSVVAHDPAVLDRIASWGWQPGLRPRANAPTWPMDAFRDRFVSAYGPRPVRAGMTSGAPDLRAAARPGSRG